MHEQKQSLNMLLFYFYISEIRKCGIRYTSNLSFSQLARQRNIQNRKLAEMGKNWKTEAKTNYQIFALYSSSSCCYLSRKKKFNVSVRSKSYPRRIPQAFGQDPRACTWCSSGDFSHSLPEACDKSKSQINYI